MVELLRGLRRHPSAVGIVVRTRLVRDLQVIETRSRDGAGGGRGLACGRKWSLPIWPLQ